METCPKCKGSGTDHSVFPMSGCTRCWGRGKVKTPAPYVGSLGKGLEDIFKEIEEKRRKQK